jgi:hypothetical protein
MWIAMEYCGAGSVGDIMEVTINNLTVFDSFLAFGFSLILQLLIHSLSLSLFFFPFSLDHHNTDLQSHAD